MRSVVCMLGWIWCPRHVSLADSTSGVLIGSCTGCQSDLTRDRHITWLCREPFPGQFCWFTSSLFCRACVCDSTQTHKHKVYNLCLSHRYCNWAIFTGHSAKSGNFESVPIVWVTVLIDSRCVCKALNQQVWTAWRAFPRDYSIPRLSLSLSPSLFIYRCTSHLMHKLNPFYFSMSFFSVQSQNVSYPVEKKLCEPKFIGFFESFKLNKTWKYFSINCKIFFNSFLGVQVSW